MSSVVDGRGTEEGQQYFVHADNPISGVVTVTPVLAARWLKRNKRNRTVRDRVVARYARDMRDEEWVVTGESVKFDTAGRLIDGQHRLHACIKAQSSFETVVIGGLTPGVFEYLDAGKKRSASDVLSIHDFSNTTNLASIGRVVYRVHNDVLHWRGGEAAPTRREVLETIRMDPDGMQEFARMASRDSFNDQFPRPSKLAGMLYVFHTIDEDMAMLFREKLVEGIRLEKRDPVRLLREKLHRWNVRDERLPEEKYYAYIIKVWNKFVAGEELGNLLYSKGKENFPTIAGLVDDA